MYVNTKLCWKKEFHHYDKRQYKMNLKYFLLVREKTKK